MQRKKKWNGYIFLVAGWRQKERQRGNKTASPTADSGQRNKIIYWCCRCIKRQEKHTKYQNSAMLVIIEGTRLHILQVYHTLQPRPKQSPRWGDMQCPIPGTHNSHGHPGATRLCSPPALLGMKVSPASSSHSHFLPYNNWRLHLSTSAQLPDCHLEQAMSSGISHHCLPMLLITSFPNLGSD